jgi:hypothetical protein
MATDPYHAVQREVQTSLQAAETLHASYLRIRSTARNESEELIWARNEVTFLGLYSQLSLYLISSHSSKPRLQHWMQTLRIWMRVLSKWYRCFGTLHSLTRILYRIVEETGARMFGLEEGEVAKRRQYVSRVRRTVQVGSTAMTKTQIASLP